MDTNYDNPVIPHQGGMSFQKAIMYLICILMIVLLYQFAVLQVMVTGSLIRQEEAYLQKLTDELQSIEAKINMTLYDQSVMRNAATQLGLQITDPDQVLRYFEIIDNNEVREQDFSAYNRKKTIGEKLLKFTGIYKNDNGGEENQ